MINEEILSSEKTMEIQRRTRAEVEVLHQVLDIANERIEYSNRLIQFVRKNKGNLEVVRSFLRRNFPHVAKEIHSEIFIEDEFIPLCKSDMIIYLQLKKIILTNIREPNLLDIVYDIVHFNLELSKKLTPLKYRKNSAHEFLHIEKMKKILKPYIDVELSTAYYEVFLAGKVYVTGELILIKLLCMLEDFKTKLDFLRKKIEGNKGVFDSSLLNSLIDLINDAEEKYNEILSNIEQEFMDKEDCDPKESVLPLGFSSEVRALDIGRDPKKKPKPAVVDFEQKIMDDIKNEYTEDFYSMLVTLKLAFNKLYLINKQLNYITSTMSKVEAERRARQASEKINESRAIKQREKLLAMHSKKSTAKPEKLSDETGSLKAEMHQTSQNHATMEALTNALLVEQKLADEKAQELKIFQEEQALKLQNWKKDIEDKRVKRVQALEAIKIELDEIESELQNDKNAQSENAITNTIESKEVKEKLELSEAEIKQLIAVAVNMNKDHRITLDKIFNREEVRRENIELLIKACAKEIIAAEKIQNFNLIEFDGSHFSARLPNTYKIWDGQIMSRRMLSTVNSWIFHGASHDGPMSPWAVEQLQSDFARAGITPKRIDCALELTESRKVNARPFN